MGEIDWGGCPNPSQILGRVGIDRTDLSQSLGRVGIGHTDLSQNWGRVGMGHPDVLKFSWQVGKVGIDLIFLNFSQLFPTFPNFSHFFT